MSVAEAPPDRPDAVVPPLVSQSVPPAADRERAVPSVPAARELFPGYWVLARFGRQLLRPGGTALTARLLSAIGIEMGDDVVDVTSSRSDTAPLVLARKPSTYLAVSREPSAVRHVAPASADVVLEEAYLSTRSGAARTQALADLGRITRPGGRIGLHEVAFGRDDLGPVREEEARRDLASVTRLPVDPLTIDQWCDLLDQAGFDVEEEATAPLALFDPRRLVAGEGLGALARLSWELTMCRDERARLGAMWAALQRHREHTTALVLTAVRR